MSRTLLLALLAVTLGSSPASAHDCECKGKKKRRAHDKANADHDGSDHEDSEAEDGAPTNAAVPVSAAASTPAGGSSSGSSDASGDSADDPTDHGGPAMSDVEDTSPVLIAPPTGEIPAISSVSLSFEHRFRHPLERDGANMNYPSGLTVDSNSGDVYAMDLYFNLLKRFAADGTPLNSWKVKGGLGMHVDPVDGGVWVAMRALHKVRKYSKEGELLLEFGEKGRGEGEFLVPIDISIDHVKHEVYVVEHTGKRVQVFDRKGQFIRQFEGDFRTPFGISVHPEGDFLVVANTGNRELQKFTTDGELLARWYRPGSKPGEFRWPRAVAVTADGKIFVADTDNERGQLLDSDGNWIRWVQGPNDRELGVFHPRAVDVNIHTGDVYYAAAYSHRIDRFTPKGDFMASFAQRDKDQPGMNTPKGIDYDAASETIFVADWLDHRIRRYALDGELKDNFDCWIPDQTFMDGTPVPESFAADPETGMWVIKEYLCFPAPIAVDNEGGLFMVRGSMHYDDDPRPQADWLVRHFTTEGEFIEGFGHEDFPRNARVRGMALDHAGRFMYLANSEENLIMKFTWEGELIWSVGKKAGGRGASLFDYPSGIAVDAEAGRVFVLDSGNDRVAVLDLDGNWLGSFGGKGSEPGQLDVVDFGSIEVDPRGVLIVSDTNNHRIQFFDYNGKLVGSFGERGHGPSGLFGGGTMTTVHDGRLWVLDQVGRDVERYTFEVQ